MFSLVLALLVTVVVTVSVASYAVTVVQQYQQTDCRIVVNIREFLLGMFRMCVWRYMQIFISLNNCNMCFGSVNNYRPI